MVHAGQKILKTNPAQLEGEWRMKQALLKSWLAWGCLAAFAVLQLFGADGAVASGVFLLLGAVLGMNGLAQSALFMAGDDPSSRRWREHPRLQFFHHITAEGELLGITVGVLVAVVMLARGEHVHLPVAAMGALLGIMSAARIAVRHLFPVMGVVEAVGGVRAVIVLGSFVSALTGPAAAVLLGDYLAPRVAPENRARVATGLGAAIGSGNGLLPFAAPPIAIVWGTLQTTFGWSVGDLIALLGVGCVAHVVVSTMTVVHLIGAPTGNKPAFTAAGLLPILGLVGVVTLHIAVQASWVLVLDVAFGVANIVFARREYAHVDEDGREGAFTATWQPLILAGLLGALELIGVKAEPAIQALAGFIPSGLPVAALAIGLLFATATTSHFADNALASRAFIVIPASMLAAGTVDSQSGNILALAVVAGALFGGFLLIPANLPNFYLARVFRVSPGEWLGKSWMLYPTGVIYVSWILFQLWWV